MKTCSCGRHYTANDWLDLKPLGLTFGPSEFQALDMRNCSCTSTMAVPVTTHFNADEYFDPPAKEAS